MRKAPSVREREREREGEGEEAMVKISEKVVAAYETVTDALEKYAKVGGERETKLGWGSGGVVGTERVVLAASSVC